MRSFISMLLCPSGCMRAIPALLLMTAIASLFAGLLQPDILNAWYSGNDFPQYWSALSLLRKGANPYSPSEMLRVQQSLNPGADAPMMMWNPPWLLYLLRTIMPGSFESAARLWLLVEILSPAFLLMLFLGAGEERSQPLLFLLSIMFFPYFSNISLGQLGPLLLLGVSLAFIGMKRQSGIFTLAGTAFMTLKPHIFYLMAVPLVLYCLRNSRSLLLFLLLGAIGPFLCTIILDPNLMQNWLQALNQSSDAGFTSVGQWLPATIGGALQAVFSTPSVRLLPPILALAWIVHEGMARRYVWTLPDIFTRILAISCITAPYGWLFDQLVLLPMWAICLSRLLSSSSRKDHLLVALLLMLQLGLLAASLELKLFQHYFFWYPILLLSVFLYAKRPAHGENATDSQ